jgi:hypothetical protein
MKLSAPFLLNRVSFRWKIKKTIPEFVLTTEYFRREHLHVSMKQDLINSSRGVKVLWGQPDCGKSTTTYRVVNELIENHHFRGVIFTKGNEYQNKSFKQWYESILPSTRRLSDSLSVGSPLLIVVDHAEGMIQDKEDLDLIKSLAQESVEKKLFTLMFSTKSLETAESILSLNGAKKVKAIGSKNGPCFDITFDAAMSVAKQYKEIRNLGISTNDLEIIAAAAVESKSFGTVVSILTDLSQDMCYLSNLDVKSIRYNAQNQHIEWKNGRERLQKYYPLDK